jgi:hypothetical protein
MPFNLLLIPLLGGYIFVRFWNYTKILMLRADKDRILIRASLAGLISLVPAFLISSFIPQLWPCAGSKCLYTWWATYVPFDWSGTAAIAFLISSTSWRIFNIWCSEEDAIDRAIAEDADPLETALKYSKDSGVSLAITLKDQKVYIGVVTHQFNPATPTNNIAIMPLQSGYREPESKRLRLKINYAVIIQKMRRKVDALAKKIRKFEEAAERIAQSHDPDASAAILARIQQAYDEWSEIEHQIDLFEVVIPVSQIASVFFFDEKLYSEYCGYDPAPAPVSTQEVS